MDLSIDRGDVDTSVAADSPAASRRRDSKVHAAKKATIILLLVALSATVLLQQSQNETKTVIMDRIHTTRDTLVSQTSAVSGWVANRLPGVTDTRRILTAGAAGGNTIASSSAGRPNKPRPALSAEGADMEWEKSESLLRQLHPTGLSKKGGEPGENNVLHRALEGLEGIFHRNNKKEGGNQRHRRLKATDNKEERDDRLLRLPSNQEVGGFFSGVVATISNSPIAAAIFILCGVAILIVSVIVSPDSRRLRRLANSHENRTIVLDEEEAEIVEFYEKEMESGKMQSIPFLEDIHPADECREDDTTNEKTKRSQSFTRIPSSEDAGIRVSPCDSYYSRVLQDIESFDEVGDDQEAEEESCCANECGENRQNDLLQGGSESSADSGSSLVKEDDQQKPSSAQEQQQTHNEDDDRLSSPNSSSSSISSLTSEVYADIESQQLSLQPGEVVETSISNVTTSPISYTTPKSSVKRRRSVERNSKAKRRVSFSPEVKVREIPLQINSERHLYLMLLTVAIVITFCSLLPAPHPSLSVPISDMTAGEMIQRADNILKSQWEVEL